MSLGYWLLSMFLVLFLMIADMNHRGAYQARQAADSANQQRARQTVHYINTINDYLYAHPQNRGVISEAKLGFASVPSLAHVIEKGRVFVYQPNQPGLMRALRAQTRDSALLGRVHQRRLVDNRGDELNITLPNVIPDTALVYLN